MTTTTLTPDADFTLTGHGTVYLLTPQTPRAQDWCRVHLPEDRLTLGRGIAVEPRYVKPIVAAILDDGLTIAS